MKVQVFKLSLATKNENGNYEAESGSLIVKENAFDAVIEEVKAGGLGSAYLIELDEMEEDEVDNLPEFDGF